MCAVQYDANQCLPLGQKVGHVCLLLVIKDSGSLSLGFLSSTEAHCLCRNSLALLNHLWEPDGEEGEIQEKDNLLAIAVAISNVAAVCL